MNAQRHRRRQDAHGEWNSIDGLERWVRNNVEATPGDSAAAENVILDLRAALRGTRVMGEPVWWNDLTGLSDVLRTADRELVEDEWEGGTPPLTLRLGRLGTSFARSARERPEAERRAVLDLLERVMASGSEAESTAVATGFLEALDHAGCFHTGTVWDELGPRSQEYLTAWRDFWEGRH